MLTFLKNNVKPLALASSLAITLTTCLFSTTQVYALEQNIESNSKVENDDLNLPCPSFWTVQPNPSVENSLSYLHDSGKIAINVTYISNKSGPEIDAENFSRVASEQMNCSLPVRSSMLDKAWSFSCDDGLEALVYGPAGNLVLLSISGRDESTEKYFQNFIRFLSYEAGQR